MRTYPFREVVTSEAALRELIGEPWELNLCKQLSALDAHCRAFLARSPFVLVATANRQGQCDVSPRGDVAGFVRPLTDTTLVLPERPGNRRADTLRNILENPHVGLLFVVPGRDETLRVNGRAAIVRDAEVLAACAVGGKEPLLAVAVEVEECFLHCGRAFRRARLWAAADAAASAGGAGDDLPSLAQMLMDQVQPADVTLEELEREVEAAYERLY